MEENTTYVTIIDNAAPAINCMVLCAFTLYLNMNIGIRSIYNGKAMSPYTTYNAVTGPAIPLACALIFHFRFITVISEVTIA